MNLSGLLPLIRELPQYVDLVQQLETGSAHRWQVHTAAQPYLLAALQRERSLPVIFVASSPERARQVFEQTRQWLGDEHLAHHFPAPDTRFYDKVPWDPETVRRRVQVLAMLADRDQARPAPIIVTSINALMPKSATPSHLAKGTRIVAQGARLDMNSFLTDLLKAGYQASTTVEESGYFSRRGGIIDVYAPNQPYPIRIDLFGDEIDSLRQFDPETQRSIETVEQVTLSPATEAIPFYGALAAAKIERMNLNTMQAMPRQRWQQDLDDLAFAQGFRGIEFYLPLLYAGAGNLSDFLSPGALLVLQDRSALQSAAMQIAQEAESTRAELMAEGSLPEGYPCPYFDWQTLDQQLGCATQLDLSYLGADDPERHHLAGFRDASSYGGQLEEVMADAAQWQIERERTVIVSRQAQRLNELFREQKLYPDLTDQVLGVPPAERITLVQGLLARGWSLIDGDTPLLTLLTDAEIFGWTKVRGSRRVRRRAAAPETFFADLRDGDYVVHIDHGIAIYRGMDRKAVDGIEREYLELEYAAGDRLYVPTSQADQVARYVGGGENPGLHRLGTADWDRVKRRAKRAIQNIARDLLKLYAAREVVPGYSFASDSAWQAEMEAAFPYQETEDQMDAIQEVKADMEKAQPMDRLVCGDVGYGKTEVALRAAFKAVMDGKQVAVLVPTTVLAQQHYITFRDRLEPFPVKVDMLSRFRSRSQQQQILKQLAGGQIDIIVGTHRLIQKDVEFFDLGLLVIDEEQRFGVVHKERLKQMRSQVDVLTLTATPIPRTLYMALTGARDMSVIDTPPEERLPIRTQVAEMSDSLVRKAILREKSRGGQVYFVHNRVQGIRQIAQHLSRIVPEVSIVVGHGQMREHELAEVMLDFMAGKYDVLVCTTIIESGLDIPSVNTIIINQADKFGLAQLYQLRGRVGRSSEQAYAYLLYNQNKPLSDVARMRLETIMEASELGAGYRVAMRDLEIRGAGDILGAQQHGQIASVGFDLYTRLLAQAVKQIKEEGGIPEPEAHLPFSALAPEAGPSVDLPLSAHLPAEYVPDDNLRLKLYQRLANLSSEAEIEAMAQELRDRFGSLPEPTSNLLYLLRLKVLAKEIGAIGISRDGQRVTIRFERSEDWLSMRPAVIQHYGNIATLRATLVILPWGTGSQLSQQTLLQVLETMAKAKRSWE